MSESLPAFSIVVPTYNRANLIGKTIGTILQQTFKDFEVVVVDDGGNDNTEAIIREFGDPRLRYYKKVNEERGAARNFGCSLASGKYINFFDSDDLMYSNHLSAALKMIEANGNPEFFHLGYDYRSVDGQVVKQVNDFKGDIRKALFFNNILSCNGVFLRRDIAIAHPFEPERKMASSEDWELWIRLISRFKFHYSNEITTSVVNHDQRSLFTIDARKVITRDLLLIDKLKSDRVVMDAYGGSFKRYVAERYTFFMLCLSELKEYSEVWRWGFKAVAAYPFILVSRRFLASIRNSL